MRIFAELRVAARPALFLAAIAVIPALLSAWWHAPETISDAGGDADVVAKALTVPAARALAAREPVLWIDARPIADFAAGTIAGALPLRHANWEDLLPAFVEAWQPGRPVVVFCGGGECDAAKSVATRLQREFGLTEVSYLEGGWSAWRNQP